MHNPRRRKEKRGRKRNAEIFTIIQGRSHPKKRSKCFYRFRTIRKKLSRKKKARRKRRKII